MTVSSFDEITTDKPEKSLTVRLTKTGGRNQQGKLTVRHRGGGHKRLYRIARRTASPPVWQRSSTIRTVAHALLS